jgi:hypothetical protein
MPGGISPSGRLHYWENKALFPNGILRCFWISEVGEGETRGDHAHYKESQVLIAVAGKVRVEVETLAKETLTFDLSDPGEGVFVPPMNWVKVHFSPGAVVLGLSNREFSEEDYIRDKSHFGTLQNENI